MWSRALALKHGQNLKDAPITNSHLCRDISNRVLLFPQLQNESRINTAPFRYINLAAAIFFLDHRFAVAA